MTTQPDQQQGSGTVANNQPQQGDGQPQGQPQPQSQGGKQEDLDAPKYAALLRRWRGDQLQRFHAHCHKSGPAAPGPF